MKDNHELAAPGYPPDSELDAVPEVLPEQARQFVYKLVDGAEVPDMSHVTLEQIEVFVDSALELFFTGGKMTPKETSIRRRRTELLAFVHGDSTAEIAATSESAPSSITSTRSSLYARIKRLPEAKMLVLERYAQAVGLDPAAIPYVKRPVERRKQAAKPSVVKNPTPQPIVSEPLPRLAVNENVAPLDKPVDEALEAVIELAPEYWPAKRVVSFHDYMYGGNGPRLRSFRSHLGELLRRYQPTEPLPGANSGLHENEWQLMRHAAGHLLAADEQPLNFNQLTGLFAGLKGYYEGPRTEQRVAAALDKLIKLEARDHKPKA